VGIVGATGAGKSTLLALLNRFYDPDSEASSSMGRMSAGTVSRPAPTVLHCLQDSLLLCHDITENIAYAKPDAHKRKFMPLQRLPTTRVHSRFAEDTKQKSGARLPTLGGERQRIS